MQSYDSLPDFLRPKFEEDRHNFADIEIPATHVTQDRTRHPGFPAMQLRLTCDQICTRSESLHVKYGAKEKKRNGNNWDSEVGVGTIASISSKTVLGKVEYRRNR